jgi:hypothetical protein
LLFFCKGMGDALLSIFSVAIISGGMPHLFDGKEKI